MGFMENFEVSKKIDKNAYTYNLIEEVKKEAWKTRGKLQKRWLTI